MNKTNDFKYNLPAYSDPVDIEDLNDNFRGIDDALMAGLCKKDYTGNNMGSSDPSARKYAWAPWLEIVNDNEFDVVVTDRNAPVGSEEATINIAAGQTFRKYINGRYYMNFYVQDQYDVTFKWFTNAETYINESGGGGGGTGTVTSVSVQGGSGSHLTASGNPIETSGTITIDVDEGYSIPSDNEQTAWDGKAADLKAEIDSSTYVLTLQLKDSSGNLIGNERTIDLPLETMVVDGEYDPQTKKIKLELKNGNYVEFSVADLVSGLQTELSSSNKLDPAFIAYDSTHAAVTEAEKNTYAGKQNALTFDDTPTSGSNNPVKSGGIYTALNGKQDTISDLSTIRSGATAGATAVQPAELNNYVPNSSLVDTINNGAKNIYDPLQAKSAFSDSNTNTITIASGTKSVTFTLNGDNSITVSGATEGTTPTLILDTGDLSKYSGLKLSGAASASAFLQIEMAGTPYDLYAKDTGTGADITTIPAGNHNFFLRLASNTSFATPITIKPMICTKSQFGISPAYEPHALGNQILTPALIEQVDSGAKNLLNISNATFGDRSKVTFNSDGSVTGAITDDTRYWNWANSEFKFTLPAGNYVLYCAATSGTNINWGVALRNSANAEVAVINAYTGKDFVEFTLSSATELGFMGKIFDRRLYIMLCTKAAWNVSHKFVQYRPNWDLVGMSVWNYSEKSFTSTAANTYEYSGVSFTVPANQIYEFIVMDRKENARTVGILVADNNSSVESAQEKSIVAENTQTYSGQPSGLWGRQVTGMTAKYNQNNTFYVWVKRDSAAASTIQLAYRRIY